MPKTDHQRLAANVKIVLAKGDVEQAKLRAIFAEVVQEIHRFVTGRKLKVFEVHHMVEIARAAFLQAVVDGRADQDLYMCGLAAVGLWNPLCLSPPLKTSTTWSA